MKRITLLALFMCCTLLLCTACHEHTPGSAATCTQPQVCTECGEVLTPAAGHTPGPDATCTEPQICTVCGEIITPAAGHIPAEAVSCTDPIVCSVCAEVIAPAPGHAVENATCAEDQVCSVCGEVIAASTGHTVDPDTGVCSVCGKQVTEPGWLYVGPGTHGESTEGAEALLPETASTGHYTNDIDAYYANAVLVCGDYGIEYFLPSASSGAHYADVISAFAEKYPDVNVTSLLAPKCAAYESPEGYTDAHDSIHDFITGTYDAMSDKVVTADSIPVMDGHAGEYMFYRTDHHWTSLGAYYASVAYCEANGITPYALDTYDTIVRADFVGTLGYYSGNDSHLNANPDYTVFHFPHTGYTMRVKNGGWSNGTALNTERTNYAYVFIGGDNPLTVFESDNKNGKCLMIFKDSYGNAFVPYMIDYYERVVVVDIREDTDGVGSLIEQYGVTDALILNNVQGATSLTDQLQAKLMS